MLIVVVPFMCEQINKTFKKKKKHIMGENKEKKKERTNLNFICSTNCTFQFINSF